MLLGAFAPALHHWGTCSCTSQPKNLDWTSPF